jgi:uncharacterized protein YegP (UPF0339 family)
MSRGELVGRARVKKTNREPRTRREIIAASQGYEPKANTEKGIESVKSNAAGAAVVDLTG